MNDTEKHPSRSLLAHTAQALKAVLVFEYPADNVLARFFRENNNLGQHDRLFISESIYAILRRLQWLYRLAGEKATPRQLLLAWLARGQGWPIRKFEHLTSPAERNWITTLKTLTLTQGTLAQQTDFPDWLVERLNKIYDEKTLLELARSLNQPAPLDLRINLIKNDRETILTQLNAEGIKAQPGQWSPYAIRLEEKIALQKHSLFLDGSLEIQDEGSQLLGFLVQPRRREMVIDFCAGAGGKTLLLGSMMRSTGRLYALDINEKRLAKLRPRAARAGLSNIHPMLLAHERDAKLKRLTGKADRVLVDAPCSGIGTLRRNPDLKWRQSSNAIEELQTKQQAILESAARLVRPGGRLIYATCSLLSEENDEVVDTFLNTHPTFRILNAQEILKEQGINLITGERLHLSPLRHGTDGFFAAVFERTL